MLYQFVEVAAGKVGTADAALKQHIPREHAVVCRAIVHQAAWRVSRHMDGFQFRIAEGDDVSIVQISAQGHGGFLQLEAEHAALFRRFVNPELIGLVGFGLQTELFQHERIAEDMVQMQMGIQQMFHIQPILDDEVFQGLLFFLIKTARVNDDRFIGFVPKHITVLREHIKFESLYFHIMYLDLSPYIYYFLCLEELLFKELLQVPQRGLVLDGHGFISQFAPLEANQSVGQCILLFGGDVLADNLQ